MSLGHHGIEVETQEKTNVMSPFNNIILIIGVVTIVLLLTVSNIWIKVLSFTLFGLFTITWLIVYCCHSIKAPELLQSEKYRLEKQKREAGIIENKSDKGQTHLLESPKYNNLIESNTDEGDIYE